MNDRHIYIRAAEGDPEAERARACLCEAAMRAVVEPEEGDA